MTRWKLDLILFCWLCHSDQYRNNFKLKITENHNFTNNQYEPACGILSLLDIYDLWINLAETKIDGYLPCPILECRCLFLFYNPHTYQTSYHLYIAHGRPFNFVKGTNHETEISVFYCYGKLWEMYITWHGSNKTLIPTTSLLIQRTPSVQSVPQTW